MAAEDGTVWREGDTFYAQWAVGDPESGQSLRLELKPTIERGKRVHAVINADLLRGDAVVPFAGWSNEDIGSSSGRKRYLGNVVARLKDADPDANWSSRFEHVCTVVIRDLLAGEPPVALKRMDARGEDAYAIRNFIPAGETSILVADGGSLKSTLALALALAVRTGVAIVPQLQPITQGPVVYCDWETTAEEQMERLTALCDGAGVAVPDDGLIYQRMTRPLIEEMDRIRRLVNDTGAIMVVIDSFSGAASDELERSSTGTAMLTSLRTLGPSVTRLAVSHVSKADARDKTQRATPFGSAMFRNLARAVWELRKSELEDEDTGAVIGVFQVKANRGKPKPPFALRWTYNDAELPDHADWLSIHDVPDLAARLPLWKRVEYILVHPPRDRIRRWLGMAEPGLSWSTKENLAKLLGDDAETPADERAVEKALNLLARWKRVQRFPGGEWRALARDRE